MKEITEKITEQQRKALHVYFRQLAGLLAEQHFDFREMKVELTPTEQLVKDHMWKPVQEALYGKKSTTELTKDEVSVVYDHLHRALIEHFGINLPFPEDPRSSSS